MPTFKSRRSGVDLRTVFQNAQLDADYLRELGERLMKIPVEHGTDQGDVFRLNEIAEGIAARSQNLVPKALQIEGRPPKTKKR